MVVAGGPAEERPFLQMLLLGVKLPKDERPQRLPLPLACGP